MDKYLNQVVCKSAIDLLKDLPDQSVHCIITSPPYYGLRSYLDENDPSKPEEVGAEQTPEQYVEKLVEVFHEARRVLRDDGTLWLNLGDSYAGSGKASGRTWENGTVPNMSRKQASNKGFLIKGQPVPDGYKPKDLLGIPFRVAFALQSDGWYWRSVMPWIKPNAMPESIKDRPTSSLEYVFLFSKSKKYYYDYENILRPYAESSLKRIDHSGFDLQTGGEKDYGSDSSRSARKTLENFKKNIDKNKGRRYRNTDAYYDSLDIMIEDTENQLNYLKEVRENRGTLVDNQILAFDIHVGQSRLAHFASFPQKLIKPMIIAGCSVGDVVLDFFCGTGTTGLVASQNGRQFICGDLNPEYVEMAQKRILDGSGWS